MKKLNQHLLLAATMLLMAGSAYAQGPTNQYKGFTLRTTSTPTNNNPGNQQVSGASERGYNGSYSAYSQDSYVSQVGNGNSATVDQQDGRTSKVDGGSSATLTQTGNNNNATQRQNLTTTSYSNFSANFNGANSGGRNLVSATQAGSNSQVDQTQNGGGFNSAIVNQGTGTTGNRAIQTQNVDASGGGDVNQAVINQTRNATLGTGSGNRAEQTQSGIGQTAQIDQQSTNSYAKQTQSGGSIFYPVNSALIQQGAPGSDNTAMQTQSGQGNVARIQQSVGANNSGSNNYAKQTQTLTENQADIIQRSSNNYAEQQQSGVGATGHNYSSITQSNVMSAAYTTQTGINNSVTVTQH